MEIRKGYCRITMKNGQIAFGEVLDIKERNIDFLDISPASVTKRIPISDISDIEEYVEDDIPAYE